MIMISIQEIVVLFVDYTRSTMFHPLWLCCCGFCCLYELYRWVHQKYSFAFLFIRVSAFEVLNADKRCACSTHHEEYCDNFQQKCQPLMQFGPQIFFLLLLTIFLTCWTLASSVDIDGRPLRRSLSTLLCPTWKCLCLAYTRDFSIALSPTIRLLQHDWCRCQWFIHMLFRCRHLQVQHDLMHTEGTNDCCYAFRCYEMAKLFVWWCHEWYQIMR